VRHPQKLISNIITDFVCLANFVYIEPYKRVEGGTLSGCLTVFCRNCYEYLL